MARYGTWLGLLPLVWVLAAGCGEGSPEREAIEDPSDVSSPDAPDAVDLPDGVSPDTGEDTQLPGDVRDVEGPDTDARPDADADAPDTDEPTPHPDGLNACGGETVLRYAGSAAEPLGPCGLYGEGRLICEGFEALSCVEEADVNACGSRGALRGIPGTSCGCGGVYACSEDGDVVCRGGKPSNGCGGCADLQGLAGKACVRTGDQTGIWACAGADVVLCAAESRNACFGDGALVDAQGRTLEASPGESCETNCGPGTWVCDGEDRMRCVPRQPCNACGGTNALPGEPGGACGPRAEGTWTCAGPQRVVCQGTTAINVCGGLEPLEETPGASCGDDLAWMCLDAELVCVRPPQQQGNACGGETTLAGRPGSSCGACGRGIWRCDDPESVRCTVSDEDQVDACGGCGADPVFSPGDACGPCGAGTWTCEDDAMTCVEGALDGCGGCFSSDLELESACAFCGVWACDEDRLLCAPSDAPSCTQIGVTCAALNCAEQNRACTPSGGGLPARCGDCLEDFVEIDGQCLSRVGIVQGVTATVNAWPDRVVVIWNALTDATGYHVYRDGVRLTTSPVTEARYEDRDAEPGDVPGPVGNLQASTNRSQDVRLAWSAVSPTPGPEHRYRVRAVFDGREGERSVEVTGRRAGPAVTGYQVRVDGGAWQTIGMDTTWTDTSAASPTIQAGTITATTERVGGIEVVRSGATVTPGAERTYHVRAVSEGGTGSITGPVQGRRSAGTPQAWWERSSGDAPSGFSTLDERSTPLVDTAPTPGAGRYYRARYELSGLDPVRTPAVRGVRRARACSDLDCAALNRTCDAGSTTQDAACGGCLPGFETAGDGCGVPLQAPTGVTASVGTHSGFVRVQWEPVPGAERYEVFRGGTLITPSATPSLQWDDTGASAPGVPSAPANVQVSRDQPDAVYVTWDVEAGELAPRHTYTVRAVRGADRGPLSEGVEGARMGHPYTAYQVRIGTGSWITASEPGTFRHESGQGNLRFEDPTASTEQFDGVALSLSAVVPEPGPTVSAQVRANSSAGQGTPSAAETGWRLPRNPQMRWQRSAGASNFSFSDLPGADGLTFLDTTAPIGIQRWYRPAASAEGISGDRFGLSVLGFRTARPCDALDCASENRVCVEATSTTDAVCGDCDPDHRDAGGTCVLRPVGPQTLIASDASFRDHVRLQWSSVANAEGYAIYRDGELLRFVGASTLQHDDATASDALVPGPVEGVAATTDDPERILVTWDALVPPDGVPHEYRVTAFIDGDETRRSPPAIGRRAGPPVLRYEVTTSANATFPSWRDVGDDESWEVIHPPHHRFVFDTITATDDLYEGVFLEVSDLRITHEAVLHLAVRAVTSRGAGAKSDNVIGQLGLTEPDTFRWSYAPSTSSQATHTEIDDSNFAAFLATDIPRSRDWWFRVRVEGPGFQPWTSSLVRGARRARLFEDCVNALYCDAGGCVDNVCTYPGMTFVEGGTFTMGSPETEPRRGLDEGQREVTLEHDFFMFQNPATRSTAAGQWGSVGWSYPPNGGGCTTIGCPLVWVTWWSVLAFANELSIQEGLEPCYQLPTTGCSGLVTNGTYTCPGQRPTVLGEGGSVYQCEGYRLPTEAEWEYVYRAGTTTMYYNGDLEGNATDCSSPTVASIAWYCGNRNANLVQRPGQRQANAWGFQDMAGNMREWVWDAYFEELETLATVNPQGPPIGTERVTRGGFYDSPVQDVRAAARDPQSPEFRANSVGFRLVRTYFPED